MEEPLIPRPANKDEPTFWGEHRLALLLIITVCIALVLTVTSMIIYNSSGAAQLDLSRPGFRSVSDKIDTKNGIDGYSASGVVSEENIKEFIKLYDEQAAKAKAVDAFNGDPLNPEVLHFGTPATE